MRTQAIQLAVSAVVSTTAAALSGSALASPFTLNFSGSVTQTSFDPFDPLQGAVAVGSPFYSYLNFDTNATDAVASPNLGSYTLSGFPYGFAPVVGSVVFPVMSTVNISVANGVAGGPDLYTVFASEGSAGGLGDYFSISVLLQDDTGTAFSNDALPDGMPDLSRFSIRTFNLNGQYTDLNGMFVQYEVQGNITVPEPLTGGLAALALLACAATTRGDRRRGGRSSSMTAPGA
jgi:hypothetical protein